MQPGMEKQKGPSSKEGSILPTVLQQNQTTLGLLRIFSGVIAGVVAGILGLEGTVGCLVYLTVVAIGSVFLWLRLGCNTADYFLSSSEIWVGQIGGGGLTFVLIWTFF